MLPNLIIIGAQKAGTSSLHNYLSFHPEIFMSAHKELNFFCKELNWKKGLEWYKSNFKNKKEKVKGESSPAYSQYPLYKQVSQRMHSVIPKAKLIYIIRNPLERMTSHYLDRYTVYHEQRSPEEALSEEKGRYIQFSKYFMQIEKYLKYYQKEQILIIKNKDLREERIETLKQVFKFLGIDSNFSCDDFHKMENVSKGRRKYPKQKKAKKIVRYLRGKASFVPQAIKKWMQPNLGPGEPVEKPVLGKAAKIKILGYLKEDIEKMQDFSKLDLSDWFIN